MDIGFCPPSFSASVEMTLAFFSTVCAIGDLSKTGLTSRRRPHVVMLCLICYFTGPYCAEDIGTLTMVARISLPVTSWPSLVYRVFFSQSLIFVSVTLTLFHDSGNVFNFVLEEIM